MAFRVLTGLGMGGAMPNAIALTSEYMPRRRRGDRGDDDDLRLLAGRGGRRLRRGRDHPALRLAIGVRRRRRGSAADRAAPRFVLPDSIRFLLVKGGDDDRVRRHLARIAPGTVAAAARCRWRRRASTRRRLRRDTAVTGRPCGGHGAHLDRLLHEPAEPVLPEQLAADDHQRRRHAGGDGHPADGAVSGRRHRRRDRARHAAGSPILVLGAGRLLRCGRRCSWCSSAGRARRAAARPDDRRAPGWASSADRTPATRSRRSSIRSRFARPASAGRWGSAASARSSVRCWAACCSRAEHPSPRCSGRRPMPALIAGAAAAGIALVGRGDPE